MTNTTKLRLNADTLAVPMLRAANHRRAVILIAFVASGCVLSVDPVVSESAATFDPRLLGAWQEVAGSDRAVVSRGDGNSYRIAFTSEGKTGRFQARLGRLGSRLVLDVQPAPVESELEPYSAALIAGHVLLALDLDSSAARTALLERDTLRAALAAHRLSLAHTDAKDRLVLRGTTNELRAGLTMYLGRSGALAKSEAWRRVRS